MQELRRLCLELLEDVACREGLRQHEGAPYWLRIGLVETIKMPYVLLAVKVLCADVSVNVYVTIIVMCHAEM